MNQSKLDVIKRLREKRKNQPWHKKLKRKLFIKKIIYKSQFRHYASWLKSKEYRKSYGDCDCFKGKREINEEHCKNDPKCNLKKIKLSYIDISVRK